MPRNADVPLTAGVWTQLTANDVTAIRLQGRDRGAVKLMATVGATAPADDAGHIILSGVEIIAANYYLSDLWPAIVGANRVWGWSALPAVVSVSHA